MTTEKYTKVPYVPSTMADWINKPLIYDESASEFIKNLNLSDVGKDLMITLDPSVYPIMHSETPIGISFEDVYGTSKKYDRQLSNIHEPIAEHEKRIVQLEDIVLELRNKLERKQRKPKTNKRKSKSSERTSINKRINRLEKIASKYEPDWKYTQDMHRHEAKDTTEE